MKEKETRRDFLRKVGTVALAIPFLSNCTNAQKTSTQSDLELIKKNAAQGNNNWSGAIDVPNDVIWKSTLADKKERGEPLIISGTVYMPDGKTPVPNILIYAYHTDTEGIYGREGEPNHGRFRGWMLTDEKGKYEIITIKPAPYPSRKTPAHIHYTITGKTFKEDWIDTLFFDGDALVTEDIRRDLTGKGGFQPIVKLDKKAGVLHGVRDIKLEKDWV